MSPIGRQSTPVFDACYSAAFGQDPWLFQAGEPLQGVRQLLAPTDGGRDHVDHGEGRMEVATRLQLLDRHAGRGQGLGVGDAFVAQEIDLGRHRADQMAIRDRPPVTWKVGDESGRQLGVGLDADADPHLDLL